MSDSPDIPDTPDRPTVKLRPGKGRRLAHGFPWALADEIAMDRRTKALAPGALARLVDGERSFGLAAMNPAGTIAARVIDADPEAVVDAAWFRTRLRAALDLRARLFDAPYYRLVHAEGDGLPGLVIDRFGDVAVIQPNSAWIDARLDALTEALVAVTGVTTVVVNATARGRRLEGLEEYHAVTLGRLDAPVPVPMNGAIYMADLLEGQKTGLFYDQRPNHAFASRLAAGGRVLDVFAHVGGFGLACLAGGAAEVLAVDSSAPALELAEAGARAGGMADRFTARRGDAFDTMAELAEAGETYELVICDPPAFAPSKQALPQGLRAYEKVARLAARLVAPGGWMVLCSCSHAAGAEAFLGACHDGMRTAGRSGALVHAGRAGPDHPQHTALPETGYLKAMAFRLDG